MRELSTEEALVLRYLRHHLKIPVNNIFRNADLPEQYQPTVRLLARRFVLWPTTKAGDYRVTDETYRLLEQWEGKPHGRAD